MAARRERDLVVGDIVDLTSRDDGIPFRTKIEDMKGGRLFAASVPSSGGSQMMIHMDDELQLTFYRETGRYTVRIKVVGFDRRGDERIVLFTQLSEPERDQRRMYFRLPVSLNVNLCDYLDHDEDDLPVLEHINEAQIVMLESVGTKDLSITGIAVMAKNDYEMGRKFVLKLDFDAKNRKDAKPFIIYAEIMRKDYDHRTNSYRLGMHFFGQTQSMSEFLAKYVLKQQTIQIRQRRLVEGE